MFWVANRIAYEAINLASRYAPAIMLATIVAGATMLLSGLYAAMAENGFVPQVGFVDEVFAISSAIFLLGMTALTLQQNTSGIIRPVRNTSSNGQIISGRTANQRYLSQNPGDNPPYRPASLASEGKVAADADLVRVYTRGVTSVESRWTMLRADARGLTPAQLKEKYSLPYTPTHVVDVDAAGKRARVGIAGPNYGHDGGNVQVELLERGATFTNPRPIGQGGAQ